MEAQGDPVTMDVKGDLVYRFRGRHYIIAGGCHGGPQDFGQGALKDIPTDPINFLGHPPAPSGSSDFPPSVY